MEDHFGEEFDFISDGETTYLLSNVRVVWPEELDDTHDYWLSRLNRTLKRPAQIGLEVSQLKEMENG